MSKTQLHTLAGQMITSGIREHRDHPAPLQKAVLDSLNAVLAEGGNNGISIDSLGDLLGMVTFPQESI